MSALIQPLFLPPIQLVSCRLFFLINLFIYLFIYFRLRWVFVSVRGLSLVVASGNGVGGLLFVAVCGLLIAVASHCRAWALGAQASVVVARGLSSCGSWALGCRLSSCGARASHCGGLSCCRAQALGTQGSVVVARGLSCSTVYGIFRDQGSMSSQGSPCRRFLFFPSLSCLTAL